MLGQMEYKYKSERRDHTKILVQLLCVLRDHPYRLTKIMYKANLSHRAAKKFIEEALDKNLVLITGYKEVFNKMQPVYFITDKGLTFIANYEKMIRESEKNASS